MGLVIMAMCYSKKKGIECMNDNLSRRRKKYAIALLAVTTATVGTSFTPSAPWVMASKGASGGGANSNIPPTFNPPVYTEVPFDSSSEKIEIPYYHVQAGDNVTVTTNTFTETDFNGNVEATFNNFIVKANDTLVEDSDDIVVDKNNSEHAEKGSVNGVTRKYKLTLSKALKDKIDKAATGGGGAAPSKLEDGTNTTVEGDGTDGNKYKVNLKSDVTNITSISGDATNGLTLHSGGDGTAGKTEVAVTNTGVTFTTKPAKGKGTTITINGNGIDVSSKKITGLGNGAIVAGSTDAVTGGQLHSTNTDVANLRVTKLDKTAERHIKSGTYSVENGKVTLTYTDGTGADVPNETAIINGVAAKSDLWSLSINNGNGAMDVTPATGKVTLTAGDNIDIQNKNGSVTISAKDVVKSLTSTTPDALTVNNTNGAVTVTAKIAGDITKAADVNKLVTAGTVNTAINAAITPLADKNLSNISDAGKKVITSLGTEVVQGDGVTVGTTTDATGKKTYTISAVKLNFAAGTNTTLEGDGTVTSPYKYNVNPALTGITSITGDTGLTFIGAGTAVTINGNGVNVGGTRVTNLADADLSGSSTDAVTGKQLHATNTKVTNLETTKLDKTAERHIKPSTYTVTNGSVTLNYVDGEGHDVADTTTINGVASTSDVWKLGIKNNGDKRATAITPTADGKVTLKAGDNVSLSSSNGEVTISAKNTVKSIISGDANTLTVTDNNGDVTLTPVVATDITSDGDKNKLVTAGIVNTAITPLAKKNLSNIDVSGKKVITSLGTKVAAGTGIAVQESEDTTTGQKTYTVSSTVVAPKFANGTNTTVSGDGTEDNKYTFNISPTLTGITSIANDNTLTLKGGTGSVTISNDGVTVNSKVTGVTAGDVKADSTDAINGSQLFNERVTSPVIFVDKDGNQVFRTADNKFVTKAGTEITDADELAKIHTKVNAVKPMTLDNVASTIENMTVPNAADPQNPTFKEKLTAAAGNDATKHAVVNVEDLHKATTAASDSTVAKGLDFYGDDTTTTGKVHRDLGTALKIQGADTYTRKDTDTTGTTNISVTKNASGDGLNVAMANTLRGITSITNGDGATDVASTTMHITGDGVEITNAQPAANGNKASKTTVTIGKDGINAGSTKITNVAEGAINETSTDVVIGKQLHATNTDVANLKLTKLDKTDDVHIQAGEYAVNDKTGTVELTLAKGENDTDTGKKVKISGIVTHAVLSNTMDAYELNIEGDENTTNKNSLKKGVAVHGASNFTPDEATKNAGINIQAKATDKGFDVKLADTLTNMKGITFEPATKGAAPVSLTSTGLDNGGNRITNVAAGQHDTDAVNVSQLKNLAHATVAIDSRINRLGAQSAAMAGLRHLQYDPMEPTTVMAGVGTYKGQTALALGVAHYKNESLLFHAGASIGSDPNELMANAGVSWKFGFRADETAVKDTYRQGPISSSYALQDKVAALEAQNQMQKEEINELKAQLAEVLQYIKKG